MRLRFFLLSLIALVALAGCGEKGLPKEKYREHSARRIVSLSPGTSEIVGATKIGEFLVGRTSSCDWPDSISRAKVVVQSIKPDYEAIAALESDLVIYDANLYGPDDIAKLKEMGVPTLALEATNIEQLADFIFRLGSAVGSESYAGEYVDKIYAAQDKAIAAAGGAKPRTMILMGEAGDYMAAGKGSFQGSIITAAGGTPLGPDSKRFEQISVEEIIRLDPQILLSSGSAAKVLADPRLATVSAVKSRQVYDIDEDVILRIGGRTETLLEAMGQLFARAGKSG